MGRNLNPNPHVNRLAQGIAAVGLAVFAAAAPAAGQERPRVSMSESSRSSGPTCVVGAAVSDCGAGGGGGIVGPIGPVLLGAPAIPGPAVAVPFALDAAGNVTTDAGVDRSTRPGTATAR